MGFDLGDLTKISIDGTTCMAEALSKIEDGLRGLTDSEVRSEEDHNPGLLRLLRDYLAGFDPSWQAAGAIEIAFELGKAAADEKTDLVALRERLLRGPIAAGEKKRREADLWREPAKQTWREQGGVNRSMSQSELALLIQTTVAGAKAVTERTVIETIQKWERESGC
jgi:hypothetical protein